MQDDDKAINWFLKSAEQGNANAQLMTGRCYYYGEGVSKDYDKAYYWFLKSAEHGNTDAQFKLVDYYGKGIGTQQNYEKASQWALETVELRNIEVTNTLVMLYKNGKKDFDSNALNQLSEAVKECIKSSDLWLIKAEQLKDKKLRQIQYQIAFLESARILKIYDSIGASYNEYNNALKRIKSIYNAAIKGNGEMVRAAFRATLNSSSIKSSIPANYRNSGRLAMCIVSILLFALSTFMLTCGRGFIENFMLNPDIIVMASYFISSLFMTCLLWMMMPNILKKLFRRDNLAFVVPVFAALSLIAMFIHSQSAIVLISILGTYI